MTRYSKYFKAHVGKVSDKWASYLHVYDFVADLLKPNAILEVGVQNGGSLEIWSSVFPEAKHIIGIDIDSQCASLQFSSPAIKVLVTDSSNEESLERATAISPKFDLIVDDGSHNSLDIIQTLRLFLPTVSDGGIYVIEDLHASYWKSWAGGLVEPLSAINFLKRVIDVQNFQHWSNGLSIQEYLGGFLEVEERFIDALYRIKSIQFLNSVAIIQMSDQESSSLGVRLVVGTESKVSSIPLDFKGHSIAPEPQTLDLESLSIATNPNLPSDLFSRLESLGDQHSSLLDERDDLRNLSNTLTQERDDLTNRSNTLESQLQEILASRLWRWTSILRKSW
jgi:cephalosporin hydroxylase